MNRPLLKIVVVFVFTTSALLGQNNRSAVSLSGNDLATCTDRRLWSVHSDQIRIHHLSSPASMAAQARSDRAVTTSSMEIPLRASAQSPWYRRCDRRHCLSHSGSVEFPELEGRAGRSRRLSVR